MGSAEKADKSADYKLVLETQQQLPQHCAHHRDELDRWFKARMEVLDTGAGITVP